MLFFPFKRDLFGGQCIYTLKEFTKPRIIFTANKSWLNQMSVNGAIVFEYILYIYQLFHRIP